MSSSRRILKIIANILTTIILILFAFVVYGKATVVFSNNPYPNYFGYTFFSIASGSMEPTLYVNDVILVKIGNNDIKNDDIVTYMRNKEIITHRVISVNNNLLTVKGDNNNTIDDPINNDQVIGKVIKVFPKLSIWQKVITEPKILIAIFITFLLFDFALCYKGKETTTAKNSNKPSPKKKEKPKEEVQEKTKQEIEEKQETDDPIRKIVEEQVAKIVNLNKPDTKKKDETTKKVNDLKMEDIDEYINNNDDIVEDDSLDYTVRLDLDEIQRKIKNKVK